MVEKKTDRRILKTKRALRESLLYLLKEQPIQKISVSRLCEKSDINRSTFYTYYSSPMDLLESIEDEILNTLEEDMIQFEKENSISQLMNSIIFYISEHKQLVSRFYFCWIFAREINKMDFHNTCCYYNHRFFSLKNEL